MVSLVFRTLWYNVIFGKSVPYDTTQAKKQNIYLAVGLELLLMVLLAFFLYNFVWHEDAPEFQNFGHGVWHGAFLGVFAGLPIVGIISLRERRSWRSFFVNFGFWMGAMMIMGGILNVWR